MHVKEHIEFTHKVISNTSLQSEVGIAGGYSKDWVATKPKFCFFFFFVFVYFPLYLFFFFVFFFNAIICTVQDIFVPYLFYFLFQKSPKTLDLSYTMGLDFWACFRREYLFR